MGMNAASNRLYHLGVKPVPRSTFADANAKRPYTMFEALFGELYTRCLSQTPKKKFSFENKLFSLDASVVDLCLNLFPWAKFRTAKGGIKMHTVIDHDGYLPAVVTVTEAKCHEVNIAKLLKLPKGSIVVFDRGYNDYTWFRHLCKSGVFLVTRLKSNARFRVIERHRTDQATGVTSDHIIQVAVGEKTMTLRRVGYRDQETGNRLDFLTNHMTLPARTIADIYKERWQVEIFFRFIKQNLKIKSFLGNSKNAVLSQVYVALIAYLLLAYQKCKRSIRRVLSGRAGSRISSGKYDEALRIAVLGQEGLALGVSGCRRQVLEEVAQIAVWLQPVGLGRFDEGVDGGRGVGSARMA